MKRILLITNICFEPYLRTYMNEHFQNTNFEVKVNVVLYEECKYNDETIENADIIVICLNFEAFYPNIINDISLGKITYIDVESDCLNKASDLYEYIKEKSNAKVIWFSFEDYYCQQNSVFGSLFAFDGVVDRINLKLTNILKKDLIIDFKQIIATVGIKKAYDNKGKYRWGAPYSKETVYVMAEEIYKQYLILNSITKKCLVLDCDNVLWGGILSEDGISGIQIGESGSGRLFKDFQRYLLDLYYHGVILTVCSKNDEPDVLQVFREHSGMILKEKHIAYFCCNWDNKSRNIQLISDKLNIGLESMVFVDDSQFEVNTITHFLPEIKSILFNKNTIFYDLSCFNLKKEVDMDTISNRTKTYQTDLQREKLKFTAKDFNEYLELLNMNVDIHLSLCYEIERISELTQRTNKCSNGARYTLGDLETLLKNSKFELYTVCLSDRFSDLGIVGTIGVSLNNLELFSLSCRALGRSIESYMIDFIKSLHVTNYKFYDTKKNQNLKQLFDDNGFHEAK